MTRACDITKMGEGERDLCCTAADFGYAIGLVSAADL
jgi:hypothetical protein